MVTRRRTIHALPARVWDILSDGWLYTVWMVGASTARSVDVTWPDTSARVRHLSGAWPVALTLDTTVTDSHEDRELVMVTESQVLGDVRTRLRLTPKAEGTEVELTRENLGGIRRVVPLALKRPLVDAWADDCLLRLSFLAERR